MSYFYRFCDVTWKQDKAKRRFYETIPISKDSFMEKGLLELAVEKEN